SGAAPPYFDRPVPIAGSFFGLCFRSGEILRCDDAQHDPLADPDLRAGLGSGSIVAAPLRQADTPIGVLCVSSPTLQAFVARDEQTLQLAVGLLASAMNHLQAFAANRQLLEEYQVMLEAMDQSEQRARALLEKSPIGTCIVDEHGNFEVVNP